MGYHMRNIETDRVIDEAFPKRLNEVSDTGHDDIEEYVMNQFIAAALKIKQDTSYRKRTAIKLLPSDCSSVKKVYKRNIDDRYVLNKIIQIADVNPFIL